LRRALAAALALAALALPATARANGDPCSDTLTFTDICLPGGAKIPAATTTELASLLTAASKKGTQIKVAVIATPGDLGLIPQLFGKPQNYARFLGQELLYTYDGVLLVVMKQGYGVFHGREPVRREVAALLRLPKPLSGKPVDLAAASLGPVRRLAAVEGTAITKSRDGGNTRRNLVIAAAGAALLALAVAGVEFFRSRRQRP
jgi:hypothetical protein